MAEEAPAAPAEAAPPVEGAPPSASRSRDPNRPLLFRYWSRPTHLQYRYLYDYRHNYYNDVIDYLDRKNRGLQREIPRPQTWPERVLRSYKYGTAFTETRDKDWELIHNIRASNHYYHYHTRDYLMRRYPALAL